MKKNNRVTIIIQNKNTKKSYTNKHKLQTVLRQKYRHAEGLQRGEGGKWGRGGRGREGRGFNLHHPWERSPLRPP